MNSKTLLKCLCMCLAMFAILVNANAQDLKSILTGVAKAVVGDKATTSSSIIGTWKYVGPQCQFESENLLAKAGGEVAAKEVEEKMQTVYDRIGMSGCEYTFNEDGTYSYTLKKRTMSGTYTFDDKEKTITMKGKLGVKTVAHVTVTGNDMSLVFNADKLMSVLKTITGTVTSATDHEPLIGVTVKVLGANTGSVTDFDGDEATATVRVNVKPVADTPTIFVNIN